jgi:uncharacterized protein
MFSWVDLGTTDTEAAKKFYAAIFGWTYDDAAYSMAKLRGLDAAAIAPLNEMQKGAPPHFTCYFTVDDVDASTEKAAAAGANIVAPPFDVMDVGRMSAVDDPTGAGVALWQPKKHIGAGITNVHGALTWCELRTRDVDASRNVWTSIFGWTIDETKMPNGVTYTVFKIGGVASCGMMPMPSSIPAQVPSHWLPYFQVDDCDATVKQVSELGGKIMVPAMDAANVGRFATLADPQGAVFGVLTPA